MEPAAPMTQPSIIAERLSCVRGDRMLFAGLRGGAALAGLLLLPMAVPILIFGAGGLQQNGEGGTALAGAVSLLLVAVAPFAAGAAIRAARE